MTSLGDLTPHPTPTPATRATRPGWRDPRLWIGVAIVAVSVVAGAQLLAAADDSVAVWSTTGDLAVGAEVTAGDLESRQVRFVDAADLDRYVAADQPLPATSGSCAVSGRVSCCCARPRRRRGHRRPPAPDRAGPGARQRRGRSVVSVYVRDTSRCRECAGAALDGVTVVDAPSADDLTGARQIVLAVEREDADRWFALLAGLDAPVITVLGS